MDSNSMEPRLDGNECIAHELVHAQKSLTWWILRGFD